MRRICLLALALVSTASYAMPTSQKDTLINTNYKESEAEIKARQFNEVEVDLPALPDTNKGNWFDLSWGNDMHRQPKILLSSIQRAHDGSIRYILNNRSESGYDNLSAEGFFCASSSISYEGAKTSSFKIFGYGDQVNKRWIKPRNAQWKSVGNIFNNSDPLHFLLFRTFCEDGVPAGDDAIRQRVIDRAGKNSPDMVSHNK